MALNDCRDKELKSAWLRLSQNSALARRFLKQVKPHKTTQDKTKQDQLISAIDLRCNDICFSRAAKMSIGCFKRY